MQLSPMEVLNTVSPFHSKTPISCCFSPSPFPTQNPHFKLMKNYRKLVIVQAKKKTKDDSHSFVVKPDEATGPFPEAVLLKQKKVQKDGRVLPEFADDEEEKLFESLNLQMESDLNLKEMRHYEVVYLIHEDHKDEVGSVNSKVEEFIKEKKGRIWRFSDWGMRRLAYKIKKAKNAHYILMNFELEASLINNFKSMLDKEERVIRHLVIKRDNAITENCPPPIEFHSLHADMDDNDDDEDMDYDDEDDMGEEDDADDSEMVTYIDNVEEDSVVSDKDDEGSAGAKTMKKKAYA